ncbi:MAG: RidA family protein [Bacteroidales bacterium]|nr:RidA family protein [Bacteroidales bacterium]
MKKIIATSQAPAAIGPYSQAIEVNNMLFISGQLPVDPATGEFASDEIKGQTEQVFRNIKAVLSEAGYRIDDVVKTTVFLSDMSLFAEMNAVYATHFGDTYPVRSTVAVKDLPKKALVEIETIAAK